MLVPDSVEPVVAWRSWHIDNRAEMSAGLAWIIGAPASSTPFSTSADPTLYSLTQGVPWMPGERMEAKCDLPPTGSWQWLVVAGEQWVLDQMKARESGYESTRQMIGDIPAQQYVMQQMNAGLLLTTSVAASSSFAQPPVIPKLKLPLEPRTVLPSHLRWALVWVVEPHVAPDENCRCGLYAVDDVRAVPGGAVLGRVNLWGKIVPGTQGYRAQYGYPKDLFVLCHAGKLGKGEVRLRDVLAEKYGVPVKIVANNEEAKQLAIANDALSPERIDFFPPAWNQ